MKIKDKEAKFKNKRAIFLSPKLLLPILLETTLDFIIGLSQKVCIAFETGLLKNGAKS